MDGKRREKVDVVEGKAGGGEGERAFEEVVRELLEVSFSSEVQKTRALTGPWRGGVWRSAKRNCLPC